MSWAFVDNAHATAAQFFDDFVMRNRFADHYKQEYEVCRIRFVVSELSYVKLIQLKITKSPCGARRFFTDLSLCEMREGID